MKITNNIRTYIALLAGIALLVSCSDDVTAPTYTVGEADNAIVLRAGISEGSTSVATRAGEPGGYDDIDATNHTKHLPFTNGTKAALRIDGTWLGHDPEAISQTTTATIGGIAANTDEKHNDLTMSPQRYWDDYGSADPANMPTGKGGNVSDGSDGRSKGLTIYGAAVNGVTTAPVIDGSTGKQWTALTWNVGTPTGSPLTLSQTGGWSDKDLLISNNVKEGGPDDTYKFDERDSGKLLEFTHAMSKITVRLIASEGFPTSGVGATATKFANAPEVKLTSNETGQSNAEWAYTSGSVNVETGAVTSPANPAVITMHTAKTDDSQYTVIYDALVAPGSVFGAPSGSPATYPVIARINADGNIYYVTSEKIRAAITTSLGSGHELGFATQPGKNYIITVNVKKTKIEVTATIKDWVDIEAEPIEPVISIDASVGDKGATGGAFSDFDFYLSTTAASGYNKSAKATGTPDGATKWTFKDGSDQAITLHWPDHETHYFMRGVSPSTTPVTNEEHVVVNNGQYNSSTSPSNLLIGAPEITSGTKCGSPEHDQVDMSTNGICARNNTINLNFQYVMSQVEVRLKSTGTDALQNKVTIDGNTTVEIIGGYKQARILLSTRVHDEYAEGDKVTDGKYALHPRSLTSEETSEGIIKSAMHDIIVPQLLTDDMKFRITVTNSNSTQDVYEAQLNKIKGKKKGSSDALAEITEWKPGEHYIYELDIKKTSINVTATLTDWKVVEANEDIWF